MKSAASRKPLREIVSLLFVLALFFGCLAAAGGGIAYAEQSTKEDELERLSEEIERLQAELDRIKGDSTSQTPAGVAVDSSNFPDANFRSYVAEKCDTDRDGFLSEAEIAAVTSIYVSDSEIADLTGIEFFTALESLDCSMNSLESLDMSANAALEQLDCSLNSLESLDMSANTALERLDCRGNRLTSLNVSNNTALTNIDCSGNALTSLDMSTAASLEWLDCYANHLINLNIGANTALARLNCSYNQLTSLDISESAALSELFCINNQLTSLDVSANTHLYWLMCEGNHLTHLDLRNTVELTESSVYNQTAPIELEERGGIYRLDFASLVGAENTGRVTVTKVTPAGASYTVRDGVLSSETELTSITYTYSHGNTGDNLTMDVTLLNMACVPVPEDTLAIDEHSFPDAVFRRYVADRYDTNHDDFLSPEELLSVLYIDIGCTGNMYCYWYGIADLTGIRHFPALTSLICVNNPLKSLDVSGCTSLTKLRVQTIDFSFNGFTDLDVSGCTSLTSLDCSDNMLTNLDVSTNTSLTELICHSNQLTSLDLRANSALVWLDCNFNYYLCSLDVSSCPYLRYLECSYTDLPSLDLSSNTALEYLDCSNTQLTSLDLSANPALTELYCDVTPTGWNDPADVP